MAVLLIQEQGHDVRVPMAQGGDEIIRRTKEEIVQGGRRMNQEDVAMQVGLLEDDWRLVAVEIFPHLGLVPITIIRIIKLTIPLELELLAPFHQSLVKQTCVQNVLRDQIKKYQKYNCLPLLVVGFPSSSTL